MNLKNFATSPEYTILSLDGIKERFKYSPGSIFAVLRKSRDKWDWELCNIVKDEKLLLRVDGPILTIESTAEQPIIHYRMSVIEPVYLGSAIHHWILTEEELDNDWLYLGDNLSINNTMRFLNIIE